MQYAPSIRWMYASIVRASTGSLVHLGAGIAVSCDIAVVVFRPPGSMDPAACQTPATHGIVTVRAPCHSRFMEMELQ